MLRKGAGLGLEEGQQHKRRIRGGERSRRRCVALAVADPLEERYNNGLDHKGTPAT